LPLRCTPGQTSLFLDSFFPFSKPFLCHEAGCICRQAASEGYQNSTPC
jgi:hypothetical protein